MAETKQLAPLSQRTRELIEAAGKAAWEEGYAMWGFLFAQQEAAERVSSDGQDFVCLDTFNNAQGIAGGQSIHEFIHKSDIALNVIRNLAPEGFDLEEAHEQMLAPFANHPTPNLKPN